MSPWGTANGLSMDSFVPSASCAQMASCKILMMMTVCGAWICPCCNSMLMALEWPQSSSWLFLSLMVLAGYVCVAVIHQTLTWSTGSLSRAQMLMQVKAHLKKSLHWKLTLGSWPYTRESNPCQQSDSPMLEPTELHPIPDFGILGPAMWRIASCWWTKLIQCCTGYQTKAWYKKDFKVVTGINLCSIFHSIFVTLTPFSSPLSLF